MINSSFYHQPLSANLSSQMTDASPRTKDLFDDFQIIQTLEPLDLFSFSSVQDERLLNLQNEYSAAKLGCEVAGKKIARSIANIVSSMKEESSLLVVPPTYEDNKFHSSQARLSRNVSRELDGMEILEWGLKFTGETGRQSYAQYGSKEERKIMSRKCLELCNPSREIKGRDVIIVDDVWVTGSSAQVTCDYLREKGARSVKYCGYALLSGENAPNEYLLNACILYRRNWEALEFIFKQKEPPTRHLFNMVFEDPHILNIFTHYCPEHLQAAILKLAISYYQERALLSGIKMAPRAFSLKTAVFSFGQA